MFEYTASYKDTVFFLVCRCVGWDFAFMYNIPIDNFILKKKHPGKINFFSKILLKICEVYPKKMKWF